MPRSNTPRVESALKSAMRWVAEEPTSVSTPAEIGYQQAVQLERIADALEKIAQPLIAVPGLDVSGLDGFAALDRFLEVAQATGSSILIESVRQEIARARDGHPSYPQPEAEPCATCGGTKKRKCDCRPGLDGSGWYHAYDCAGQKPCPDCQPSQVVSEGAEGDGNPFIRLAEKHGYVAIAPPNKYADTWGVAAGPAIHTGHFTFKAETVTADELVEAVSAATQAPSPTDDTAEGEEQA